MRAIFDYSSVLDFSRDLVHHCIAAPWLVAHMTAGTCKIESFAEMRKRLGWRLHLRILAFVAVTASITLYLAPNYYFATSAASGAVGLIFIRYWMFSKRLWFWMTMGAMMLVQVPFVISSRGIANEWRWSFGFLFMLADSVVMDLVVKWVSPELRRDA